MIIIDGTADAVVEEREVDTYILVVSFLPSKVRIDIVCRTPYSIRLAVVNVVAISLVDGKTLIIANLLVACYTIIITQLEIGEPAFRPFHKWLIGDSPTNRNCRKISPFVVEAKARRTLMPDGEACDVTLAVVVV